MKGDFERPIKLKHCFAALVCCFFMGTMAGASPTPSNSQLQLEERYSRLIRAVGREEYRLALEIGTELIRQSGQSNKYDDAFARIVQAAVSLNQIKLAEDIFQSLLDASPANPKAYYGIGLLHKHRRDNRAAIESFKKCLENLPDYPLPMLELIEAYNREKELHAAEQYLASLAVIRHDSPVVNFGFGQLYSKRGQIEKALEFLSRADNRQPSTPFYCYYKALAPHKALKFLDSLSVINQCEPLAKQEMTQTDRHHFRLLEGFNYILLANYAQGESVFNELLENAKKLEDKDFMELSYFYLGRIYELQGRYEDALNVFRQSHALALSSNSATAITNRRKYPGRMARVYYQLGNFEASQRLLLSALKITDKSFHISDWILWMNYLGDTLLALGETENAIKHLTESAEASKQIGDLLSQISASEILSKVYIREGKIEKASETLQTGLRLTQLAGDYERELLFLNRLGKLAAQLRHTSEAIGWHTKELALAESKSSVEHIAAAHNELGKVYQKNEQNEEAYSHLKQAADKLDEVRAQIFSENNRLSFQQNSVDVYRQLTALLMKMHRAAPSKRLDALARDYAERTRARALTDGLSEASARLETMLAPELLNQQRQILMRLSQAETNLTVAQSKKPLSMDEVKKCKDSLNEISTEFRVWQEQVRQSNPLYAHLRHPKPLRLEQVQQLLKGN